MTVALILVALWLWTGVVYHLIFFSSINPAAYLFGSLCIVQAGIFLFHWVVSDRMAISPAGDAAGFIGTVLIVFALVVYPALGYVFGRTYPYSPTFGAPCPTTIFTFGILLWDRDRVPVHVIAIPFIWSLIGFTAALSLTIYEDMGLLVAGLSCVSIIAWRNWSLSRASLTPAP